MLPVTAANISMVGIAATAKTSMCFQFSQLHQSADVLLCHSSSGLTYAVFVIAPTVSLKSMALECDCPSSSNCPCYCSPAFQHCSRAARSTVDGPAAVSAYPTAVMPNQHSSCTLLTTVNACDSYRCHMEPLSTRMCSGRPGVRARASAGCASLGRWSSPSPPL